MSIFSEAELAFLREARLARLATIGPDGAPQVRPVGFVVNAEAGTVDIAGMRNPTTQKWRNVQRDRRVALVVDDVLPPVPRPGSPEVQRASARGGRVRSGLRRIVAHQPVDRLA